MTGTPELPRLVLEAAERAARAGFSRSCEPLVGQVLSPTLGPLRVDARPGDPGTNESLSQRRTRVQSGGPKVGSSGFPDVESRLVEEGLSNPHVDQVLPLAAR